MCFSWCYLFDILWYWHRTPCLCCSHPSSHNIIASLCCCSVDYFILIIAILMYDCKPTLNIIVTTSLWE
jgi:hypothetical protein